MQKSTSRHSEQRRQTRSGCGWRHQWHDEAVDSKSASRGLSGLTRCRVGLWSGDLTVPMRELPQAPPPPPPPPPPAPEEREKLRCLRGAPASSRSLSL